MRRCLLAVVIIGSLATELRAEVVRFRYVPVDACGKMAIAPSGPDGALGVRQFWLGGEKTPATTLFRPTHMVTYRHPVTCGNVVVPLTLPEGTPNIEHQPGRIAHNYGSYTVSTVFLDDGSVEVIYNSGLGRPLRVQ